MTSVQYFAMSSISVTPKKRAGCITSLSVEFCEPRRGQYPMRSAYIIGKSTIFPTPTASDVAD